MFDLLQRGVRTARRRKAWFALLACGLLLALSLNLHSGRAYAEDETPTAAAPVETPAQEQAAPAVAATTAPESAATAVPATSAPEPAATAAPATAAPEQPATPATGSEPATVPTALPGQVPSAMPTEIPEFQADGSPTLDLLPLPKVAPGELISEKIPPAQLAMLKTMAEEQIDKIAPVILQKLDDKYYASQDKRIFWFAVFLLGVMPLLGFIGFMLVPVFTGKKIRARIANPPTGRLYRLYLLQAAIAYVVLLVLGAFLLAIQVVVGQVGRYTNPQLALQENAIQYVVDDRENLVNDYTDLFLNVANDLNDPEQDLLTVIVKNAEKIRDDPALNFLYSVYNVVGPFLGYIFWVTIGIALLFYFIRIWPDVKLMARYPVEVLAAEREGRPIPTFASLDPESTGPPDPTVTTPGQAMRYNGMKLGWIEFRVVLAFAASIVGLAIIMSFFLAFFYVVVAELIVGLMGESLTYFLYNPDSSTLITASLILAMVFLVECIILFIVAFAFLSSKIQVAFRARFRHKVNWTESLRMTRRNIVRFLWVGAIIALMGTVLAFANDKVLDWMDSSNNPGLAELNLIITPIILLVGLNLVCWLLRVFKTLANLFKSKVDQDARNLPPPPKKPKKKEPEPVAV